MSTFIGILHGYKAVNIFHPVEYINIRNLMNANFFYAVASSASLETAHSFSVGRYIKSSELEPPAREKSKRARMMPSRHTISTTIFSTRYGAEAGRGRWETCLRGEDVALTSGNRKVEGRAHHVRAYHQTSSPSIFQHPITRGKDATVKSNPTHLADTHVPTPIVLHMVTLQARF